MIYSAGLDLPVPSPQDLPQGGASAGTGDCNIHVYMRQGQGYPPPPHGLWVSGRSWAAPPPPLWCGVVWYGMILYCMVWYGMVWFGMVRCSLRSVVQYSMYTMAHKSLCFTCDGDQSCYKLSTCFSMDVKAIINNQSRQCLKVQSALGCFH